MKNFNFSTLSKASGYLKIFLFAGVLSFVFSNSLLAQNIDLEITKVVDESNPHEGDVIRYTITIENLDAVYTGDATNVEVADILPAGLTYFATNKISQGTYNTSTGIWEVGSLLTGENAILELDATVGSGTSGSTIVNTAVISADETDEVPGNNTSSASITIDVPDILITKAVDDETPAEGEIVIYTVVAENIGSGSASATNLIVQDLLPTGVTFTTAGTEIPVSTTYDEGTGNWDIGTLDDGDNLTLKIAATVNTGTNGTTITNSASVLSMDQPDEGVFPNSASANIDVDVPDIEITKAVDDATPAEGETVIFTIIATNKGSGNAPATNLIVRDLLPTGLTYTAAGTVVPGSTTYDEVTGNWDIGTLDDGANLTLKIAATVNTGTNGTTITNTASVLSMDQFDEGVFPNSASANIDVDAPDLTVSKTVSTEDTPAEGEPITYTIEVINNGDAPATGVVLTDIWPADLLTPVATTGGDAASTYNTGTGVWTITEPILVDKKATLSITATINSGTSGDIITNSISVTALDQNDPNPGDDSAAVDFSVAKPDIRVQKSFGDIAYATPDELDLINFEIRVDNLGSGDAPATNLIIYDKLPTGLTYNLAASIIPAGTTYDPVTGYWTIPTLADGANLILIIAATVDAGTNGSTLTNTTSVFSLDQPVEGTQVDNASVSLTVNFPDIEITKEVSDGPYNELENLTYTITIENVGTGPATGLTIKDLLPSVVTYVSHTVDAVANDPSYTPATGILDIGNLAIGDDVVLEIVAYPNSGSSGTNTTNTALLDALDQNDTNTTNDQSSVEIIVSKIDLLLEKIGPVNGKGENDVFEFLLKITNIKEETTPPFSIGNATNISVEDILPPGYTFSAFTTIPNDSDGNATTATHTAGVINWDIGKLNSNGNITLKFNVSIDVGYAAQSITNTAEVTDFDQVDVNFGNNSASSTLLVDGADLAITKAVDKLAPNPGDTIVYTVIVTNNGPLASNDVRIEDILPSGVTYVSSMADESSYNPANNLWGNPSGTTYNLDLGVAETRTLTITCTVDAGTVGSSITNTATIIAAAQPDSFTDNNTASATISIGEADLGITKTASAPADASAFDEGEAVTYTLTVENYGPHDAPLVEVLDLLPPEVTYVSHSGGTYNSVTGIWDIGTLHYTSTQTLTINATVNVGTAGRAITNTATVSSPMEEPVAAKHDNTDDAFIQVHGADLEVVKTTTATAPIVEGDPVQYTITVTNNGPDDATGITVLDFLPTNLDFVSATPSEGTYDEVTGIWSGIDLIDTEVATLTINTTIESGGGISNTASITASSEEDSYPDNNTSSVFISALKSFEAGACVINMGGAQTYERTLKVYGFLYTLVKENQIPVYWSIRPNKGFGDQDPDFANPDEPLESFDDKIDEVDFTVNSVDYSTGAFIIPEDFVFIAQPIIDEWVGLYPTMEVNCNQPAFEAPIHELLTSFPRAVLDQQNGGLIESAFYDNIGLTNNIIGYTDPQTNDDPIYDLYRPDGLPSNLDVCDDIYAMPHADPHTWSELDRSTFDAFIKNGGWVWMACHAPSSLETLVDLSFSGGEGDGAPDMNYLSEEGLVLWGDHGDGTPEYLYSNNPGQYASGAASDPFMQFAGNIDAALRSGSEQIYIPFAAGWRPSTTIAMWDPDHPQRTGDGAYPSNAAALVAYGRAFGNPDNGMVVYEASHTIASGSEAENVGAARVYGNFWLQAGVEFRPEITPLILPEEIQSGETTNFSISANGLTPPLTYEWTSTCGGTFTTPSSTTSEFIAPTVDVLTECVVRIVVKDACGRANFLASAFKILPKADLQITKTAPATIIAGEQMTYTISAFNDGPNAALDVVVEDILPAGLTFVSATPSVGTWTAPDWSVGTMGANATETIVFVVTVDSDIADNTVLTNTATGSTASTDIDDTNNSDFAETTVSISADLVTVKTLTSADATPAIGDVVEFAITVTNNGPSDATNVSLNDLLPAGLTLNGNVPSVGSYNTLTGLWNGFNIISGATANIVLTGTVDLDQGGNTITNITTKAISDVPDPTDVGNDLEETVVVDIAPATCTIVLNSVASCGLIDGSATVTVINGDGPFTYLWDNTETDQTAIALSPGSHTVIVTDTGNGNLTTNCSIIIGAAPCADDDTAVTDPGTLVNVPALVGDDDPDGDNANLAITEIFDPAFPLVAIPLTVGVTVTLDDGTEVTLLADGTLDVTPGPGLTSTTFDYTLEDEDGLTDVGTVLVTVNQPPLADDESVVTDPETLINVAALVGDDDPDGDNANLAITEIFDPAFPAVAIPLTVGVTVTLDDGTEVTLLADGTLDVTPGPGLTSTTFDYTLEDEDGLTDVGTVLVTVNQPPLADDESVVTDPETLINVAALVGDDDPDGDNANLVITEIFDPAFPAVAIPLTVGVIVTLDDGTEVTLLADGTLDVTPGPGLTSTTFDYTLEDEDGLTDVGTVLVTVNQPPLADDESVVTDPETLINVAALVGDDDPDGDNANLAITEIFDPAFPAVAIPLTVGVIVTLDDGTEVTLLADGTLDVAPGPGLTSTTFDYTLEDEDGLTDVGTVLVTVNQPPLADDESVVTDPETLINVAALVGDDDPDGDNANLAITEIFDPAFPLVAIPLTVGETETLDDGTEVTLLADGTLDVTPGPGLTSTTFDYTLEDEDGLTDVGTVLVTVNQPPLADDESVVTDPETLINVAALVGDDDPDGDNANLAITEIFDPAFPAVAIPLTVGVIVTLDDGTEVTLLPDGTLDVTPGPGLTSTTFDYTLEDEDGLTDVGTVTVTVNQPPVADDDTAVTDPGTLVNVPALVGDDDPDGDNANLAITEIFDPAFPLVAIPLVVSIPVTLDDGTVVTLLPDGTLDVTPGPGLTSTTFDYTLEDEDGLTDVGTVTVTVNQPPVADDDTAVTDPGTLVNVPALVGDDDPDGDNANLVITEIFDPAFPLVAIPLTVGVTETLDDGTEVTLLADGTLDVTPGPGLTSTTFDYTLKDEDGLTDVGNVLVTVNQPPLADDESVVTDPETLINVAALVGDDDPDGDNANLAITEIFDPAFPLVAIPLAVGVTETLDDGTEVTLLADGTLDVTPGPGLTSTTFDYTLEDEDGLTDVGTVTVTVNQPPVADDDTAVTDPGTLVNVPALVGDDDPDGDNANLVITEIFDPAFPAVAIPLVVSIPVTLDDGTVVTLLADGTLDVTPGPGLTSTTFDYTLEDEDGLTDVGTVLVTVNQPPLADDESVVTDPETLINVAALVGDDDPDGDNANLAITEIFDPAFPLVAIPLTVGVTETLDDGTEVTLLADGTLDVTPGPGLTSTTFDYTLEDEDGLTDVGNVTVTVNQPPVADDDSSLNNDPGTAVTLNILTDDLLEDGMAPTAGEVTVVLDESSVPSGILNVDGSVSVPGEGTWVYNGVNGELTFTPCSGAGTPDAACTGEFTGDPTPIDYTLTETVTGLSDDATVTIDYNAPPIANDNTSINNTPGTAVTQNILTDDLLEDGMAPTAGEVTVVLDESSVPSGILNVDGSVSVPGEGTWVYNGVNGELTFTPCSGAGTPDAACTGEFTGDPTPIDYTLTETVTGLSDDATVTIDYNAPPIANDNTSINNTPGTAVTQNILTDDLLEDGMAATAGEVTVVLDESSVPSGILNVDGSVSVPGEGTWVYNTGTGELTFTPCSGAGTPDAACTGEFTGDPTPIGYTLTETATGLSDDGTVTIDYNAPPIANDNTSVDNTPGTAVTQNIISDDLLEDGMAATAGEVTVVLDESSVPSGILNVDGSVSVPGEGTWVYNTGTGELTFTPCSGAGTPDAACTGEFTGDPTPIGYTLTETATGLSDDGTVTIDYNAPPIANDNTSVDNTPGTAVTQNIISDDLLEDGMAATAGEVTVVLDESSVPSGILNVDGSVSVPGEGTWVYNTGTGELTFTPCSGAGTPDAACTGEFTGDPTPIGYTLTETATGLSDDAMVTVTYLPCIDLDIWVFLEGSIIDDRGFGTVDDNLMRTTLNDLRLLPGQTFFNSDFEPTPVYTPTLGTSGQIYQIAPWSYVGTEGVGYDSEGTSTEPAAAANYPSTVVDWVLVSLREDPENGSEKLCQRAGLLHSDGHIEFIADANCCTLDATKSYYIVVEHRNHLIIMSHQPVPVINGTITYDFRDKQSYLVDPEGFGLVGQKQFIRDDNGQAVYCMYGGNGDQSTNANSDTDTNSNDKAQWINDNNVTNRYRLGDYDMNGDVTTNDKLLWSRNNNIGLTSVKRD